MQPPPQPSRQSPMAKYSVLKLNFFRSTNLFTLNPPLILLYKIFEFFVLVVFHTSNIPPFLADIFGFLLQITQLDGKFPRISSRQFFLILDKL